MYEMAGKLPAARLETKRLCIVMVCTDTLEADEICRQLQDFDTASLVTYRQPRDLMVNAPAGQVALVILATADAPRVMRQTLRWLRNRWPRTPIAVVGESGGGQQEMAAREGGACYLVRPVEREDWSAILAHVLTGTSQADRSRA